VPEDFVVYADASLIKRVLQNLIANAISYTPRGEIAIGARDTGRVGDVKWFRARSEPWGRQLLLTSARDGASLLYAQYAIATRVPSGFGNSMPRATGVTRGPLHSMVTISGVPCALSSFNL
jgi:two-component system, OmpR family, phosphate regulon sensor histidine kinase PhoR